MAPSPIVNEFMKCLQQAEETRDVKRLCELFIEEAELVNLTRQHTHGRSPALRQSSTQTAARTAGGSKTSFGGPVSATAFWRQYLNAFDHIESHFTNVIDDGRTAVLEWSSTGRLPMGLPIDYNGVSILEHDGQHIQKFRTYYDSAAFLPHAAHTTNPYSETAGLPDMSPEISS